MKSFVSVHRGPAFTQPHLFLIGAFLTVDVNEAIASRRSVSRFLLDPVPAEQLARLLATRVFGPPTTI
ncbi:MAG: hypothetical protein R3C44_07265 [Chloroflexota bacterium]